MLEKLKRGTHKRTLSKGEETLNVHLRAMNLKFTREFRLSRFLVGNPKKDLRKHLVAAGLKDWRFDFALPERKLAIEVEGGVYTNGRHVRGAGFAEDCEKYNTATVHGWRVLRFPTDQVLNGNAIKTIMRIVNHEYVN